jgi:hypothetical protein
VALSLIGAGIVVGIVSLVVIVTAFVDSLSGPRFAVPGSATVDLDSGTWVLYERTERTNGFGGFASIGPEDVRVDGPAPVEVKRTTLNETVTQNEREYLGALRLEVEEAGEHTITVQGEPSFGGEVLIARPITDAFGRWPFFLLLFAGGGLVVLGAVCWIIGGLHRSATRKAGVAGTPAGRVET